MTTAGIQGTSLGNTCMHVTDHFVAFYRNFVPKAKYYSLIENGAQPTDDWTIFKESFRDDEYRIVKPSTKEESIIIEVAQKLFENRTDDEAVTSISRDYGQLFPFLRL